MCVESRKVNDQAHESCGPIYHIINSVAFFPFSYKLCNTHWCVLKAHFLECSTTNHLAALLPETCSDH